MDETHNGDAVSHVLMVLISVQVGLQPAVTKFCVGGDVATQSLVVGELMISMILAVSLSPDRSFHGWSAFDSLLVAGPAAFVYALRSLFKQVAYRKCDSVTFNTINQTKVVWCAMAAWVLLGEPQNPRQIAALWCAICAGALLVAPSSSSKDLRLTGSPWRSASGSLFAVMTAVCSGLGAALSQVAMLSGDRPSAFFNFELALWGVLPSMLALVMGVRVRETLVGWRPTTVMPVLLQAIGGLMVGALIKRRGGVAMGLCTIIGIGISAVTDSLLQKKFPTSRVMLAMWVATLSILLHQQETFEVLVNMTHRGSFKLVQQQEVAKAP